MQPATVPCRIRYGNSKHAACVLTFFSYACFHASRKIYSVIKSDLDDEKWFGSGTNDSQLGLLDALFLFFYAFGLYFSGDIGDRYDPRYVLTIGMTLVGICVIFFGLGGMWGVHSLTFFAVLWSLNGLLQSAGWPTNVAVMGNWFSREERGLVMGIWAGNASFGNILGAGIAAVVVSTTDGSSGWQWAMVVAGLFIIAEAMLIWLLLVPAPHGNGTDNEQLLLDGAGPVEEGEAADNPRSLLRLTSCIPVGGGGAGAESDTQLTADDSQPPKAIGFCRALLIPGVIQYSLAYACLKATNYALFFWLPLYLVDSRGMSSSRADYVSMLYDVGQIVGAGCAGYASDRLGTRAPITCGMIAIAGVFVALLEPDWFRPSNGVVMLLLLVTGFFMGGPANLISGCISADLGCHPSLAHNAKAMATVAGIIDGTGSLGAAVVQYLVGYLKDNTCHCSPKHNSDDDDDEVCTHWQYIFLMLLICNACACLLISPIAWRELWPSGSKATTD